MKSEKLYGIVLHLYPAAFREEYEHEMRVAFRRRSRDQRSAIGRVFLWLSVLADTFATAAREHSDMLMHDIRYSLRALKKTPVFTAAVLITLALGIGATTAIYSLVYTVLLRPLPYTEPDRLVRIYESNQGRNIPFFAPSLLNFLSWQEESRVFESLAAMRNVSANLTGEGEPERVKATAVTTHFWSMTGLQPVAGRVFTHRETEPGKDRVAIISEGLWRQRYGGDSGVLGRAILVNGESRLVVGIAPQDAGYTSTVDLWLPLVPNPAEENRGNHVIAAIGKLHAGAGIAQANAEMNAIAERLEQRFPDSNAGWRVRLMPVKEWIVGDSRTTLYVLMAAAGLLLLAACANISGLLVTRASARSQEFGVRLALGAGRTRLVRQLTTETLVLASIGGGLGILTAFAAVRWVATRVTTQLPPSTNLTVDWPVLIFAIGLTVTIGLVFGIAPAGAVRRADIMTPLRKAGRGTVSNAGVSLRSALVGGQIAIATVLVVCALLLIQSFARLQKAELGFRPDHLLTASISLPPATYATPEKARSFFTTLLAEVEGLPGVVSAGLSSGIPLTGNNPSMSIGPIDGAESVPQQRIQAFWHMVNAGYLRTLQVPVKRGRLFEPSDREQNPIVLSEKLVKQLWPENTDPIGRRVLVGGGDVATGFTMTVIGVVADVRHLDLKEEPKSTMYLQPLFGSRAITLAVRTTSDPANLTAALRTAVKRVDPAQPLFDVRTMDRIVENNADTPRVQTALLTAFAVIALVLGAVGVAGVVAYTLERRMPELALRLALGATPVQEMSNAARGALTASAAGFVLGLLGAWGLSRYLFSLLYQVQPNDPSTFAIVGVALATVSILACWLPARRASRIEPALALKEE
jgi:putative ABC transport system permease protein